MKSLASVTFSFLLLASVSLFPVYAQETAPTQKPVAAAADKPVATTPDPAKEGVPADGDASIEDILAGVGEDEDKKETAKTEPAKTAGDVKADQKPEDVKKVDAAGEAKKDVAVEKDVKVAEPSGEVLQTEKQAVAEEKQAQEQKKEEAEKAEQVKADETSVEKTDDQKVATDDGKSEGGATESTDGEELQLFEKPESMELGEKMPVETKELELPEDAAAAGKPAEGATGCIRPAGEPEEVTVPEVCDYVDIHSRRIAYRAKARLLKESLEKRRVSFEKPHFEALEKHRADIERVDAEDSVAYKKSLEQQDSAGKKGHPDKIGGEEPVTDGKDVPEGYDDIDELSPAELDEKFAGKSKPKFFNPKEAYKKAQEKAKKAGSGQKDKSKDESVKPSLDNTKKDAAAEPHVGLKEKEMPAEQDVEGNTVKNKKVVVPEDAPEFDPSLIQ